LTQLAFDKFFNKVLRFLELNYDVAELIDNSITAGYTDIYEPKQKNNFKQPTNKWDENRKRIDEYAEFFGHTPQMQNTSNEIIEECEVLPNAR